jgi:pimeloyl-ACP methyl ester carboxylesterase
MPHAGTHDGVKLYYEEAGSGKPLIFVHEYAGDYRSWEPQMRFFSRYYRCIAFNARGYPPSTCRTIRRSTPRPCARTTSVRSSTI